MRVIHLYRSNDYAKCRKLSDMLTAGRWIVFKNPRIIGTRNPEFTGNIVVADCEIATTDKDFAYSTGYLRACIDVIDLNSPID